jgi:glycosyltransferase involved in cell wall biosynthesis
MIVAHLTASRFFGGPERQMIELAKSLPAGHDSLFVSFREEGACQSFLEEVRRNGFESVTLNHDTPRLVGAWRELVNLLRERQVDVLCCHGYKANLLGLLAAQRAKVPVIGISRGWTRETFRVRIYEALDRRVLRWMDRIVCVSEGQARKVRGSGVPDDRVVVIRNAIRHERFAEPRAADRDHLSGLLPDRPSRIVGAIGRLSPEKGFDILIDAAETVVEHDSSVGFVLFGEGSLHDVLASRIKASRLAGKFVLAGFRKDLDRYMPHFDLVAVPSYTEGLPNVVLEAFAAGIPVVATAVGGIPELVDDGVNGHLVSAGDREGLADRIIDLLRDHEKRLAMGANGKQRVMNDFTFDAQMRQYMRLFAELGLDCGHLQVLDDGLTS